MCQETHQKLETIQIQSKTETAEIDDPFMVSAIKSETHDFSDNDNDNDSNNYMDDDTNLLVFCETFDEQMKKTFSAKREHKCFVCGNNFPSKSKWKLHMHQFHNDKFTYQCDICKLSCLRKSNLTTHLYRAHINPLSPSKKPDKKKPLKFRAKREKVDDDDAPPIPLDINDKSQMTRRTTCKWCVQDYGSRKKLKKHYVTNHPELFQYKCDVCKTYFMRKSNLSCHIQKIHLNAAKKPKIETIDNDENEDGFVSEFDEQGKPLTNSTTTTTNDKESGDKVEGGGVGGEPNRQLLHQCKECGIFCATRLKLLKHCHVRHPNIWNLQCHLCDQLFARQCMLSRHMRRSHQIPSACEDADGKTTKPPPRKSQLKDEFGQHCCGEPGCNAKFDMRHKLLTHNQLEHRDVWNLQCHLCSLFFKHRGNFTRHLKNSHGQSIDGTAIDEDDTNDVTKLTAKSKKSLRKKRRYECVDCQETFENQVKLWQHLATYHLDVYKYECILCKRVFKVEPSLKIHMRKIHGMHDGASVQTIPSATTSGPAGGGGGQSEHCGYSIECSMCKQTFLNQNFYQEHSCQSNVVKNEMNCEPISIQSSSSSSSPYYHPHIMMSSEVLRQQ